TGLTFSATFPTTPGSFGTTASGMSDAFVVKLNPAGSALTYAGFLGGSQKDEGHGVVVDGAGNAYVTGQTNSPNLPTTAGAFQTTRAGGPDDAFVAELNPGGTALVYGTYVGGSGDDYSNALTVDGAGNAYIFGTTNGTYVTTAGAFQTTFGGGAND